jgi:hypothetical protein
MSEEPDRYLEEEQAMGLGDPELQAETIDRIEINKRIDSVIKQLEEIRDIENEEA